MMGSSLALLIALLFAGNSDIKYAINEIPDSLKEKADIIYRADDQTFTVRRIDRATYHHYGAITLMNAKGKSLATRVVDYDRLRKVTLFKGAIYDASGQLVRRIKPGDIADQSAVSNGSLFEDDRLKVMDLSHTSYPYTFEFEYEVEYKFLFYIPPKHVLPFENTSVVSSTYRLEYPTDLGIRYKCLRCESEPIVGLNAEGNNTLFWQFDGLPAMKYEPYGPSINEVSPVVLAAPAKFQYDDYSGSMENWQNFGLWIYNLMIGRDHLSVESQEKIREMVKDQQTTEEKVKVLYQFLQNKTRYVSVQMGIGGFQPIDAETVDRTSYGDCKALSNYMIALLKVADIKANYVLIRAGSNETDIATNFPSTQFNHAIVAVPLEKDTLWLECTSQDRPFGYMGKFTGDRHALMITDFGGVVVKTPSYDEEKNTQIRKASVALDANGNATAAVSTQYSGLQYENDNLNYYIHQPTADQEKWIYRSTDIPNFKLNKYVFDEKRDKVPTGILNLELSLTKFAFVSGKRMIFSPNLLNKMDFGLPKIEERKMKVIKRLAYRDEDEITYSFPEELYPEFLPEPMNYQSIFGEYQAEFEFENGKLRYKRKLVMKQGQFPPASYAELLEFYKNISKADNLKIVLLNKT